MTEATDKLNSQLIIAIESFDAHKVEVAIQRGASANGAHLPLHAAMRALAKCSDLSSLKVIQTLMTFGSKPNGYPDPHGATPLTLAAQIKDSGLATAASEMLVTAGADLERGDGQARRALHWAAISGNTSLVAYLLDCGADIDAAVYAPGSIGCRYVDPRLAAQAAQAEAAAPAAAAPGVLQGNGEDDGDLSDNESSEGGSEGGGRGGSDDDSDEEGDGATASGEEAKETPAPRHHAFLQSHPAPGWAPGRVKVGADGGPLSVMGTTPLAWAVRRKRTEVVKMLILRGAFLDSFDGTGGTPLMIAARGKNTELVQLLRWAGARDCVPDTRSLQELLGATYNPRLGTGIAQHLVSRWQIAVLSTQSGLYSALQCAAQQRSERMLAAILHTSVSDIPWPVLRQDGVLQPARPVHRYAPYMDDSGLQLLQLGTRPPWQGSYHGARRQLVLNRVKLRRSTGQLK